MSDNDTNALMTIEIDIMDKESVKRAAQDVERAFGDDGLDILVNNAGWLETFSTPEETDQTGLALHCSDGRILAQMYATVRNRVGERTRGALSSVDGRFHPSKMKPLLAFLRGSSCVGCEHPPSALPGTCCEEEGCQHRTIMGFEPHPEQIIC